MASYGLALVSQTNGPHRNGKDHQVRSGRAANELPHALPPWKPLRVPERKQALRHLHRQGPNLRVPTFFSDLACPPTQTHLFIPTSVKLKGVWVGNRVGKERVRSRDGGIKEIISHRPFFQDVTHTVQSSITSG